MNLTPDKLKIIRESTIDEEAFQRVVLLFEDENQTPQAEPSSGNPIFDLDQEQMKLLSAIMDAIPVSIYIKDMDSRFVIINKYRLDIATQANLIGKTDFDLMDSDEAQSHYDLEQELLQTGNPILDLEIYLKEKYGGPKWYLTSKTPARDKNGKIVGLIGINLDITHRKLAEKSLENERNLLRTIIDHAQDEIYIKDRNSRFLMANTGTFKNYRLTSLEEIVGTTDFDYINHERAQRMYDKEQTIMATGQPLINQELFAPSNITREDTWYLVSKVPVYDENGVVTGLVGINRNITHRKLAEKSLENERNLLQTLIDHVQDKVYIKDRDSRFIVANAATLKVQKVSSEELLGSTDADYMPSERAQRMFDEEQTIMATGQPLINQELFTPSEVTKQDDMWYLVSKVPVYDENGVVSGLVGVNHDITNVKQAELRATELKLERERSNILADFITNSSHEFRTPISVIQTSIYLLENVDDPNKRQQYITRIMQQTARLTNLLDSLHLMSRLDRKTVFKMEPIYLQSLLVSMMDQFQSKLLDKCQDIHLINDNAQMLVHSNEEWLAIAISTILDNAIRYTPDNGEITIQVDSQDNTIIISIQDTGIGISDEALSRIFERFYRADEAHSTSGIGLGLSIAKRIIDLHEGQIEIESQVHVGSRFKILLPQPSPVNVD